MTDTSELDENVSKALRVIRGYNRYSQEQMSELIGVSRSKYQRMELGRYEFKLKEVGKIHNLFGPSIIDLCGGVVKEIIVNK